MSKQILVLPGDGIGPEIMAEAVKVLQLASDKFDLGFELSYDELGGAAVDKYGVPLADETLERARAADAILLGAVGGPKWDTIDPAIRPERGLLKIRSQLGLFGNLRPALLYPQLADASSLKPEIVAGLDILIVRELTGGIYFGQPRESKVLENGERMAYDTLPYSERNPPHRQGRFRHGHGAQQEALLGGQGERAGFQSAVARGRRGSRQGLPGNRT